jgi:tRNA(adenine34) deaminase
MLPDRSLIKLYSHEYFMFKALEQAMIAYECGEVPVGAIVVSNGKIVGKGHNMTERLNDVTAHAEMIALSAACEKLKTKYLTNATLYVTLEPCCMCAGALHWMQLERLVYAASDLKRGYKQYSSLITHPKTEVIQGIFANESKAILQRFFKELRA